MHTQIRSHENTDANLYQIFQRHFNFCIDIWRRRKKVCNVMNHTSRLKHRYNVKNTSYEFAAGDAIHAATISGHRASKPLYCVIHQRHHLATVDGCHVASITQPRVILIIWDFRRTTTYFTHNTPHPLAQGGQYQPDNNNGKIHTGQGGIRTRVTLIPSHQSTCALTDVATEKVCVCVCVQNSYEQVNQ